VGLLDAVIISNPSGMLGLPFLTKHPDFCGKARILYASLPDYIRISELTKDIFICRRGDLISRIL
jgi:hypothetical protein